MATQREGSKVPPSVHATYLVQSWMDLEEAAEILAGEQSSGTFIEVAAETPEIQARHRAELESLERIEPCEGLALPGALEPAGGELSAALIRVRFPLENIGTSIPNLLSTVAGNLYELPQFAALKLLDLDLPQEFAEAYPGPKHGIDGTRSLMGVAPGRPMVGAIVKPSVGLRPDQYAEVIEELAWAGVDFVKDDELIADPPYSPLEDRVEAVMSAIDRVAQSTGKKVMYAFNITDEVDRMLRHQETVTRHGGDCVMVCPVTAGLAGLTAVTKETEAVVHGHRAMFGALSRSPVLGMGFRAFQKLVRLAGVDHLHTNGLGNKFYETDEQVVDSIAAVHTPLFGGYRTLPVLSSSQSAATVERTWQAIGTTDVLMVAGGGIASHPHGPRAGVQSIRDAWECVLQGGSPVEQTHNERLQAALETFGRGPSKGS